MLLDAIKRQLAGLLSWNKGALYRSPNPSHITKFRGKFTTKFDFQSNEKKKEKKRKMKYKSEANNTVRYPGNPI